MRTQSNMSKPNLKNIFIKKGDNYPSKRKTFGVFLEHLRGKTYKPYFHINTQYFSLIDEGPRAECEWHIKMFLVALKAHDKGRSVPKPKKPQNK